MSNLLTLHVVKRCNNIDILDLITQPRYYIFRHRYREGITKGYCGDIEINEVELINMYMDK